MATRSERLTKIADALPAAPTLVQLQATVTAALGVEPPPGKPDSIRGSVQEFTDLAHGADQARVQFSKLAGDHIPVVWVSAAAQNATVLISVAADTAGKASQAMEGIAKTLGVLADDLERAQTAYQSGTATLQSWQVWLSGLKDVADSTEALASGHAGVVDALNGLIGAAQHAETAGHTAADDLAAYHDQAGAAQFTSPSMTGADRLMLTDTTVHATGPVLTGYQSAAATHRLDSLSPEERAYFESLLAAASPAERILLLKALAAPANYPMSQIAMFDDEYRRLHQSDSISPAPTDGLGDLSPDTTGHLPALDSYGGQDAAASILFTRLEADPVLALSMMFPDTVPYDGVQAELNRLNDTYAGGDHALTDQQLTTGLNQEVGGNYQNVDVSQPGAVSATLPDITSALDSGRPVSVTVGSGSDAHHLMIISHQGQNLQIYNPTGGAGPHTFWVSQDDFAAGNLPGGSSASGDPIPVTSVRVPHS
jgi:hypothetical protein